VSSPLPVVTRAPRHAVELVTRGLGVAGCVGVALFSASLGATAWQVFAVALLAVAASIPLPRAWMRYAGLFLEALLIAVIVVASPAGLRPSLVYLVVPPIIAGFSIGIVGVAVTITTIALVLGVGTVLTQEAALPLPVVEVSVWLAAAVTLGLATVLARHLQNRLVPIDPGYATARALLSSLRDVARVLPEGLEESVLARGTLAQVAQILPLQRAGVFMFAPSGSLVEVAHTPEDAPALHPRPDRDIWAQAFDLGSAVQRLGQLDGLELGTDHACAVIPLRLDGQLIGAVAIERTGGLWSIDELNQTQEALDAAALRLDAARMFEDIRDLATLAERQRLSREIHDGIAQQVAGLGMIVEDISQRTQESQTAADLARVRELLATMVTELRLSIFDLRVESGHGIADALAAFVRQAGTESGLTVHLVLDEDPATMPAGVGPQLLRIAQEAVTNAHRHGNGHTLWVTYRASPQEIFLRVADDGVGVGSSSGRSDSFGLMIMRERAASIGATLSVRQRAQGGTVVDLSMQPHHVRTPTAPMSPSEQ